MSPPGVSGGVSGAPDLSPDQRELCKLAEQIGAVLTEWGGEVWSYGYNVTQDAADISLTAPDGTFLTVIVQRGPG